MARQNRHRKHQRVRETAAARYEARPAPQTLKGVLYDTDVIIEILRDRAALAAAARELERAGVPTYSTAISWAEIYAGLRPGEENLAEAFLSARGEVVLDAVTGRHAGGYLARYGRSHGVEIADAFIAAAAANAGLRLWTLNRKHFPMPDVELYEP